MDVKAEIDEFADDWGLTDFQTKDLEGFAARVRREMMEEACRAVCHDCYKGEPVVLGKVKPNSAYLPRWKHKTIECSAHRIRSAFSADAKREGAGNGPELRCCVCHQFSARRLWNERLCPRCGYWNAESEGEVCWLIERSQPEGQSDICWWAGGNRTGSCSPWTWDAGKAMRYPTKIAAEAALDEISGVKGIHRPMGHVTEHAFVPMPVPADAKADVNKRERGSIECSVCEKSSTYSAWNGDVCPMCGENNAKAEEPSARAQFDSDSIVIGICTAEPAQPFIFYVSGRVSVDVLSEIEQQYAEDCLEPTTDPANVREPRGSFEEFYRVRKVQDDTPYWQFDSMSDPRVARAQFDKAAVELATWVAGELPSGRYLLVREMCNKILDATRTLGIEGATP